MNRTRHIFAPGKIVGIVFFLLVVGNAPRAHAQFLPRSDFQDTTSNLVLLDYATFAQPDTNLARLEVYYQIFNRILTFTEQDGQYVANYELAVSVDDDDGNRVQTYSRTRQVVVAQKDRAKSHFDFRTSQANFELPEGKYTIHFILRDRTSDKIIRRELDAEVDRLLDDHPTMSDIEFAQAFSMQQGDSGIFDKANVVVVPSVSRAFGGEDKTTMAYYMEIYTGKPDDSDKVVLETKIDHANGGMVYRDTLHLTLTKPIERQLRQISLADFKPGEYEMDVTLLGRRERKLYERRATFQVLWTQESMIRNNWKTTVEQLKLIAEVGELDGWDTLKTEEQRSQAFHHFWEARDPTVGTKENEAMREFYRRVAVANRAFGQPRREGWRTDRGHIYLRFGQPDEVDDVPFATYTVPYQIWHYYSSGRYRRFVFVDVREDGDYQLQYPYDGLDQRPDF